MTSQSISDVFQTYASFGAGRQTSTELDGAKFVKIFKDCGLVGKDLSNTELDIIFQKVKVKGARRIGLGEFEQGLEQVAAKKGMRVDELEEKLCNNEGPKVQATQPDYVKFHDDKGTTRMDLHRLAPGLRSTYTGVYANGGPTNVDGPSDLSELCDRSPADNRDVKM